MGYRAIVICVISEIIFYIIDNRGYYNRYRCYMRVQSGGGSQGVKARALIFQKNVADLLAHRSRYDVCRTLSNLIIKHNRA